MHTTTPTKLRKELFRELETALKGIPVHIRTRKGNAVLVPEAMLQQQPDQNIQPNAEIAKIAGRIAGDDGLAGADAELNAYLEIPERVRP